MTNEEVPDLSAVAQRLSETPGDVRLRVATATEFLAPYLTEVSRPAKLGTQLLGLISNWRPTYALQQLIDLLTIAIALNNDSSGKCASISLMRALPLFKQAQPPHVQQLLVLLIETALFHYDNTDLEVELVDLRDVFEVAVPLPFPVLSRMGGRLMAGNRNGTQRLEPADFVQSLLSPRRLQLASRSEIREGLKASVRERSASDWKRILPLLYFDQRSSKSEFGLAAAEFLKHCFSADDPPLLLVFVANGEQTWLVRTCDLGESKLTQAELHGLIQEKGVIAPEIVDDDDARSGREFFDRVANARENASIWLRSHTNNVRQLFPRRKS